MSGFKGLEGKPRSGELWRTGPAGEIGFVFFLFQLASYSNFCHFLLLSLPFLLPSPSPRFSQKLPILEIDATGMFGDSPGIAALCMLQSGCRNIRRAVRDLYPPVTAASGPSNRDTEWKTDVCWVLRSARLEFGGGGTVGTGEGSGGEVGGVGEGSGGEVGGDEHLVEPDFMVPGGRPQYGLVMFTDDDGRASMDYGPDEDAGNSSSDEDERPQFSGGGTNGGKRCVGVRRRRFDNFNMFTEEGKRRAHFMQFEVDFDNLRSDPEHRGPGTQEGWTVSIVSLMGGGMWS